MNRIFGLRPYVVGRGGRGTRSLTCARISTMCNDQGQLVFAMHGCKCARVRMNQVGILTLQRWRCLSEVVTGNSVVCRFSRVQYHVRLPL